MFKTLALGALLSLSMGSVAVADGWSGEASASGSNTTGNTETTDAGLGIKLKKEGDVWTHKLRANADYGKVDGSKNKSNWALGYQIDRELNERTYVYANADYYQDQFGAYKQGYFLGGGVGYKLILPEPVSWSVEGGPGYRSQKSRITDNNPVTNPEGLASRKENEFAVRGFSDFDFAFNDNVSLFNDTEVIWSSSDTYIWNEVGITANLMGNLAARASFRVDHHTDVPLGREKTDTATRIGVVYTIE